MNFISSTRCRSPHRRWQIKHHLAADVCEWNSIPPHTHFGGLWKAAVTSMISPAENCGFACSHLWKTCTLLSEMEACLHSRPYAPYPTTLPILHICPLDTFSSVNQSPSYLTLTKLMSYLRGFQVATVPTTGTKVLAVLIN